MQEQNKFKLNLTLESFIVKLINRNNNNSIQMDYDALAIQVPLTPRLWNHQHVQKWLQFVHLPALTQVFDSYRINGTALLSLTSERLQTMGISNNIIKRKLLRWIREGFAQYEQHLMIIGCDNKENIPPLQRKQTTQRACLKSKKMIKLNQVATDSEMVIRSCDGNLAAFYVMREKVLKIGRSSSNTIRSLQVSVQSEHSQIAKIYGRYYILDKGTEAGTFIKIVQPLVLKLGTLIQMGSFLMDVKGINKDMKSIFLQITHMTTQQKGQIIITLTDGCSFYSFGRRKTNNFFAEDEHLSGLHSKIFLQQGQFVIQDLHSTNGTWQRLSYPHTPSQVHLLEQGTIFKVGTTITYQCQGTKIRQEKMEIEYDDGCMNCQKQKKDILLLPCRHNAVCSNCAQDLQICPLCNISISQRIKIYI